MIGRTNTGGGGAAGAIKKGTIVVSYPVGAVCTVSNAAGRSYTALDTSGAAAFVVEPGTWTVTAEQGEESASKEATVAEGDFVSVELSFWDGTLYDSGNQYEAITGGWAVGTSAYLEESTVWLEGRASYYDAVAVTNNKIDLTDFTSLHVNMTQIKGGDTAAGNLAVFDADSAAAITGANNTSNYRLARVETTSTGEHTLDVSGIEGSYFVGYYVGGTTGVTRQREFDRVWLT